ncbi:hypothetical protein BDW66DRAFT_143198 [Aspergillus desertorum]
MWLPRWEGMISTQIGSLFLCIAILRQSYLHPSGIPNAQGRAMVLLRGSFYVTSRAVLQRPSCQSNVNSFCSARPLDQRATRANPNPLWCDHRDLQLPAQELSLSSKSIFRVTLATSSYFG